MQQVIAHQRPSRQSRRHLINQSARLREARRLGYFAWEYPDELHGDDATLERARERLVAAWSDDCVASGRLKVVLGTVDGVFFVVAATPSDPSIERAIVNTFRRSEGRRPLRFEGTLHSHAISRELALTIADELVAVDRRHRAA